MASKITRRTAAATLAAAAAAPLAPSRAARPGAAEAVLYRDPNCGCCGDYADHLRARGHAVRVVATDDLARIKREHGVPEALGSCHTTLVGGYVVEGHVPVGVVERLLAERPAIRGIALPGMPLGSPGMPGPKSEPFVIYALPRRAAGQPTVYAVE
jgi:hypothetical protein